jgi:hypothetical protein
MKGIEDKSLSRDILKGYLLFLLSEYKRHENDKFEIVKQVNYLKKKLGITELEFEELEYQSERYIEFEEKVEWR